MIDPLGHHGGQHYYTDQLARGLTRSGVLVTVYGLSGESICARQTEYPYRAVFKDIYGNDPAVRRGIRFLFGLLAMAVGILRGRQEIVHINVWQYSVREFLQVLIAFLLRRKIVLTIHDVETFGGRTNEFRRRFIMAKSHGLFIHNRYSFECIPKRYTRDKTTAIIPHVCHVDYLDALPSKEAARQTLALPPDRTILLFFGNPRHEKGLDIAMEAMGHLRHRPDLMLLTGGRMPRPDEERYRAFIDEHDLGDAVRMDVGTVPDELAFAYYAACDVVVVPYREVYESGVSIMAASCGRAIVASDLPVLVDFADQGKSGFLFRSEDPADLARVLDRATGPDVSLDAIGAQAKETITRERNATLVGQRTALLYDRVLSGEVGQTESSVALGEGSA